MTVSAGTASAAAEVGAIGTRTSEARPTPIARVPRPKLARIVSPSVVAVAQAFSLPEVTRELLVDLAGSHWHTAGMQVILRLGGSFDRARSGYAEYPSATALSAAESAARPVRARSHWYRKQLEKGSGT
ncbi:hypothetical protein GCM10027456_68110 [Kineosporia babensis]